LVGPLPRALPLKVRADKKKTDTPGVKNKDKTDFFNWALKKPLAPYSASRQYI
jgi:hypothetical protein